MLQLVEIALATWRLSHMLVLEAGPGELVHKLRVWTGIEYDMDFSPTPHKWSPLWCVYCTSIYVGVLMMVCNKWAVTRPIVHILAASGAAVLIDTWHGEING